MHILTNGGTLHHMVRQDLNSRWLYLVLAIVSIVFILLRFVNLGYDTPLFYSNLGTSELTDPYMYTSFARNKVLYGTWNLYDSERLISIQSSLVSGMAYLVFSIAGVSRVTANIAALILQLTGLVFFLFGLRKLLSRNEMILTIFLLAVTNLFFFGGRAPYLETGVVFASGLIVFAHFRYGWSTQGALGVGFLLAIAVFGGKLTAVAIAAPLIVDHLIYSRKEALRNGLAMGGGFSAGLMFYAGMFSNWSPVALINYYKTITSAVGISPSMPSSLGGAMQSIFSYGDTGIAPFHPFLLLLASVGVALAATQVTRKSDTQGERGKGRVLTFMIVWIIAGLGMLIPFEYRPYRYFIPYLIPVCVLAAYGIAQLVNGEVKLQLRRKRGAFAVVILVFVGGYVFEQASFWWAHYNQAVTIGTKWFSLGMTVTGIVCELIVSALLYRKSITLPRIPSYISVTVLLSSFLVFQSYLIYQGMYYPRKILERQNMDIAQILGDKAVLAGNFAPAFTIDNTHKNFYPYGGLRSINKDVISAAGITHLADPQPLVRVAIQHLRTPDTLRVMKVWAREATYMIYSLQLPNYTPTDYELAMSSRTRNRLDSALFYLDRFLGEFPNNLTAQLERANIYATIGKVELAVKELKRLSQEYNNLFYVHYLVGQSYVPIAKITRDRNIFQNMREEYEKVIELNPFVATKLHLYELINLIKRTENSLKTAP